MKKASNDEDNLNTNFYEFFSDLPDDDDNDNDNTQNQIEYDIDPSDQLFGNWAFPASCNPILSSISNENPLQQSQNDVNPYRKCDHENFKPPSQSIFHDSAPFIVQYLPPKINEYPMNDVSKSAKNYFQDANTEDNKQNSIEDHPDNYIEIETIALDKNTPFFYTNQNQKESNTQIHLSESIHTISPEYCFEQPINTSASTFQFDSKQPINTSASTFQFDSKQPINTSASTFQFDSKQPINTSATTFQFDSKQPINTSASTFQFDPKQPINANATTFQFDSKQPINTSTSTFQFDSKQPINTSANAKVSQFSEPDKFCQPNSNDTGYSVPLIYTKCTQGQSKKYNYGYGPECQKNLIQHPDTYKKPYDNCEFCKILMWKFGDVNKDLINKIGDEYNAKFVIGRPDEHWPKFRRGERRNKGIAIWFFEDKLNSVVGEWIRQI